MLRPQGFKGLVKPSKKTLQLLLQVWIFESEMRVGVKDSRVYKGNAACAEDIVFRGLGGNTNANIIMTPAIRLRNNEAVPVCTRCQTKYPHNQYKKWGDIDEVYQIYHC